MAEADPVSRLPTICPETQVALARCPFQEHTPVARLVPQMSVGMRFYTARAAASAHDPNHLIEAILEIS